MTAAFKSIVFYMILPSTIDLFGSQGGSYKKKSMSHKRFNSPSTISIPIIIGIT